MDILRKQKGKNPFNAIFFWHWWWSLTQTHCLIVLYCIYTPHPSSSLAVVFYFFFQNECRRHTHLPCRGTTAVDQTLQPQPSRLLLHPSGLGGCSGVVLVHLALCVAQPTRSSPVLTTVSWAAVTDVKSHYPNAAISLTRSRVNEFVEMCDPFLIR